MLNYYRKIIGLSLSHSFFTDGKCRDFSFSPTSDTRALLEENGVLFRQTEDGLRLFYRANNNAGSIDPVHPLGDLAANEVLRFRMDLKNTDFLNYTDLGPSFTGLNQSIVLFNAKGGSLTKVSGVPASLVFPAYRILPIRPQEFTYRFTVPGNPPVALLVVRNALGKVVISTEIERAPDNSYTANLNLGRSRPGEHIFQRIDPVAGPVGTDESIYLDSSLYLNSPFGIVELVNEADAAGSYWKQVQDHNKAPANNDQLEYSISFAHKEEIWKYTVVFKYSTYLGTPARYAIEDVLTTVVPPPDRYNTGNLPDQFFFQTPLAATTFDGLPALVFDSVDNANIPKAYPWYQEAKHDLLLAEVNLGTITKRLVKKLANPDPRYPKTEIIVFV